jgi:hypothetical protein
VAVTRKSCVNKKFERKTKYRGICLLRQKMNYSNVLNVFLALSNFSAFFPFKTCIEYGDTTTALVIFGACGISAISHLFQSHKFGMPGFGCSHADSRLLDDADLFIAGILCFRIFLIGGYVPLFWQFLPFFICPLVLCACSDIFGRYHMRLQFVMLHSLWHVTEFMFLNAILLSVYLSK